MFRSLSILTCAILVAATFAPVAQAEDRVPESTHVRIKADDLATPAHVEMLYRRIEQAAKLVCDSEETSVMTQEADKACEAQAISDTIQSVNAPQLSQLDPRHDDRRPTEMAFANGHYTTR
jgi:UrcA family protein